MPSVLSLSPLRRDLRRHPNYCRRGFTLTELAIVMGIIGVVLGGIWIAANSLLLNQKTKNAATQITTIASNVRYLYGPRGGMSQSVSTDIGPDLVAANVFPNDLLSTLTTIGSKKYPTNAWRGQVTVYAINNRTFRISYYGIDAASCTRIANALIGNQDNGTSGPVRLTTNNGVTTVDLTATTVTGQTISDTCGQSSGGLSTEFDYRIQ